MRRSVWRYCTVVLLQALLVLLLMPAGIRADAGSDKTATLQMDGEDSKPKPTECRFPGLELPRKTKILAIGAYEGRRSGYQMDQSGYEATRFDISLHAPHEPLVLMLGAYAPSVWNIGMSRRTRIVAVLLSGFHTQKIRGISPDTPLLVSTHAGRGTCGFFYADPQRRHTIDELSLRLFKREIDSLIIAEGGTATVGKLPEGEQMQAWPGRPVEDFYDTQAPRAGHLGLLDAIKSEELRKADGKDIKRLLDLLERRHEWQAIERAEYGRRLAALDAYVVQKPFVFPAGLWGSNAAVFVVERGVPEPKGEAGHATVLYFDKDRPCRGILCPQKAQSD